MGSETWQSLIQYIDFQRYDSMNLSDPVEFDSEVSETPKGSDFERSTNPFNQIPRRNATGTMFTRHHAKSPQKTLESLPNLPKVKSYVHVQTIPTFCTSPLAKKILRGYQI